VGEALENLFADRTNEFLGLLAYHFEAAAESEKAIEYLIRAGDQSRYAFSLKESVDYYERALTLLREKEDYEEASKVLMRLGLAYHYDFDFKQARMAYDEGFIMRQRTAVKDREGIPLASHPYKEGPYPYRTLDPMISTDSESSHIIVNLFSGLVEMPQELGVKPDIAESWEISDDGCKYIFLLRDDVYWSDGVRLTAKDLVFAIMRFIDPNSPTFKVRSSTLLKCLAGAQDYHSGKTTDPSYVGIRAIGDFSLELKLYEPVHNFLDLLCSVTFFPLPEHVIALHGEAWTDTDKIVTNGPFRLKSCVPDELIILERNQKYHGDFRGNIQTVEIKVKHVGPRERLEMYKSDEIDLVSLEEIYEARKDHIEEFVSSPTKGLWYVGFNINLAPFNDRNVRRAFAMSIDKEQLAYAVLDGEKEPATGGFVLPSFMGYSPGIGLPFDPEQAKELLHQAGFPNGQGLPKLSLSWHRETLTIKYLLEQWKNNLNVEVELRIVEWSKYLEEFEKGSLGYMYYAQANFGDEPIDGYSVMRSSVRFFLPYWQNETHDRLVEEAGRIPSIIDRKSLVQQADKNLIEEAGILPLLYGRDHYLVKPWVKFPHGFRTDALKDIIIDPH